MPAREKLELLALGFLATLLLAFAASFVAGLFRPAADAGPVPVDRPAHVQAAELVGEARGRVEVLNAANRSGLARQASERLRSGGFDVVYFGNAHAGSDSSVVLDRVGQSAVAEEVAARLGIRRVESRPDSTLLLDATVVIGADWQALPAPAAAGRSGWWARLKRWLGPG